MDHILKNVIIFNTKSAVNVLIIKICFIVINYNTI